ncbi:MAG: FecR domain-containing protein, partial [Bacteroidota bacterium]
SRIQPAKVRNLRPPIWQSSWMRAAAVLLLVAVGLWMVLQPGQGPQELVWTTISTQGEMRPVNLPDGSIIWLNKNSKISFPETFEERSVRLEGEAFFDVAKLDGKKFFIQAGDTKTEVLGTTFNIRAYHKEPIVEVTVFSGKVSLESAQDEAKEVILMPKDKGVYYKTGQKLEKTENADSNALAWKSGQLKFEQITLREILPTIVRFYQIKVEADSPSILNCTFTGSFEKTNLEEVLESIAFALNLEVKKQDNTYRLSGKGCN